MEAQPSPLAAFSFWNPRPPCPGTSAGQSNGQFFLLLPIHPFCTSPPAFLTRYGDGVPTPGSPMKKYRSALYWCVCARCLLGLDLLDFSFSHYFGFLFS